MHVSRNKCELIAECCINRILPVMRKDGKLYVKDVNIDKIAYDYSYFQRWSHERMIENIDFIIQKFYIALNEDVTDFDATTLAKREIKQINKYRELEEVM